MNARVLFLAVFLFFAVCSAISAVDLDVQHALVVYDPKLNDLNDTETVSTEVNQLLNNLNDNYKVTLKTYDDEDIKLFFDDALRYDHLVLLPSSKKGIAAKSGLSQHQLLDYINGNGNILVVGGVSAVLPDAIRVFLNEIGIYPSPKNFKLTDHFHSTPEGKVELDSTTNLIPNRIVKTLSVKEYEGSAALVNNNEHIFPIIKGSPTSFTAKSAVEAIEQDATWTFGEQGFLAVGFQALNNARLAWVGSEALLAEAGLYKWTFQQQNVLKLQFVEHFKEDTPLDINPTLYRIKDQSIYVIGVSELVDGKWVPYEVLEEEDQLQLAFKMLDPYQRLNLLPLGFVSSTKESEQLDAFAYFANFTVPDHHGMFTFELDYKRTGLSYLSDAKIVTVRHLANDEFKRSWDITNSWLYVASAFLVAVAWFLFVVNYIYVSKTDLKKKNI